MENLHDKRKVYDKSQLLESEIKENPIEMFRDWFLDAEESPSVSEANAMAISTVEDDGCPRTRMVLLKAYTWEGLFFTPIMIAKREGSSKNNKACLHFFTRFRKTDYHKSGFRKSGENLSDGYFSSRPRGSQLGGSFSTEFCNS